MAGGARRLLRILPPVPGPAEDIYATAQGLPVATLPEWHMKTVPAMSSLPDTPCAMIGRVIFSMNRWPGFLGVRP
ncbi:hypothetical protein N7530_007701 [Penicillium desertorum]|uniref:Uncharacterized protein n=1 Tax=Penicillium desertorum TaxID=1303715 RepID=A0A9W9WMP5_9EURO|nr:hypothetical protein N7530_007701 [Penicillium desertorum]